VGVLGVTTMSQLVRNSPSERQRTPTDAWGLLLLVSARSNSLSGYLCERLRTPTGVADLPLEQTAHDATSEVQPG
jgi:hypothetical protein